MKTDTAHLAWNDRWARPAEHGEWLVPEPDVLATASAIAEDRPGARALDLGCGLGRHALAFARLGLDTAAVDLAETGLAELARAAEAEGLAIDARPAPMTGLPFADASFDLVLSFNVIYHGDETVVRRAIAEIARVLRPGGLYQGTMLSKRNANFGRGQEIAPNTFVVDGDDDKDHPHFYCNARELVALFDDFELRSLHERDHEKPGSAHWHMLAERL